MKRWLLRAADRATIRAVSAAAAVLDWATRPCARKADGPGEAFDSLTTHEPPAPAADPPQRVPGFRYLLGTKTCGCAYKFDASGGGQWLQIDVCDHHLMAVAREWGVPW